MDALPIYLLLALVVVLLLVQKPLTRMLKRKATEKGRAAGMNYGEQYAEKVKTDSLQKAADKVGTMLVVPMSAEQQVVEALGAAKKVKQVDQTHWNLAFAKPDDLLLRWDAGADFGTLRVVRSVEMLSEPVGARQWLKLVGAIETALTSAGVQATRQQGELRKHDSEEAWIAV